MFKFLEKQMKIKRVYFAFMALLLLPVTVMAQPVIPTPQPGTAIVVASVFFNGFYGGDGPPVTLSLHCTDASYSPSDVVILDPKSFEFEQAFVLSNISSNVENVCTLTASTLAGWTTEYRCGSNAYSVLDDECVNPPQSGNGVRVDSEISCVFPDIQAAPNQTNRETGYGDVGGCVVNYDVDPVEIEVTKDWDVVNDGGEFYSFDADIKIGCDAEILEGYRKSGKSNKNWYYKTKLHDPEDYTDGMAVITVNVIPDYDGKTECWAEEDDVDSAVEVSSTCGTYSKELGWKGTMNPKVGVGDSCTITNTLFFEGIPTLNQYGMAIMALLMLGVGFVGFRRFV
jgi:hypothetical protein